MLNEDRSQFKIQHSQFQHSAFPFLVFPRILHSHFSIQPLTKKDGRERPSFVVDIVVEASRPAVRTRLRTALVVALAAVNRFSAHGGERHFRRHATTVTGHADHRAIATAAGLTATTFALVAAVLAALRLVREAALCVEGLLIAGEDELAATLDTVETLIVEVVHGTSIS